MEVVRRASPRTPTGTSGELLDSIEEMGDLENTLIFYIWGDNGASMEGTIDRVVQRDDLPERCPAHPEQQLELIDRYGGVEALGGAETAPTTASAWAWAGNTPFHGASRPAVTRRHRATRWSSPGRNGSTARSEIRSPVHSRDRHRPDDSRSGRHPGADIGRTASSRSRWTARASSTAFADPDAEERHTVAVLRVDRQPRHLQGRLVGVALDSIAAMGLSPGDDAALRARRLRSRRRRVELLLLPRTISRRPTTSPRSNPTSWPSSRSCSGARPNATACSRSSADVRVLRDPAAAADSGTQVHLLRGRPERRSAAWCRGPRRSYSIRPSSRSPRASRRCDRGQRRRDRRLRPLGRCRRHPPPSYSFLGVESYFQESTEPLPTATSR